MKKVYPVIFTQTEDDILIEVTDLEILTQGRDLPDAMEMARDAIVITGISMQDKGEKIPESSDLSEIKVEDGTFFGNGKELVSLVDIDFDVYRRKLDNKAVRRNVTLPN